MMSEKQLSVVVFERDKDLAQELVELLGRSGYYATSARVSEEFLEKIREKKADVVLLERDIVKSDIIKYIQQLQEINPKICIILMGEHPDPNELVACFKYGAFDFLVKPFDMDRVEETVKSGVENRDAFVYIMKLSEKLVLANKKLSMQKRALEEDKKELQKKVLQRAVIYEVSKITNSSTDLEFALFECAKILIEKLHVRGACVLLFGSAEGGCYYLKGSLTGFLDDSSLKTKKVTISPMISKLLRSDDLEADEEIHAWICHKMRQGRKKADSEGERLLMLSLKINSQVIGKLFIFSNEVDDFLKKHSGAFLSILTRQVATLINRITLYNSIERERDRLKQWNNDLNMFNEISHSIVSSLDTEEIIREFASQLKKMVSYDIMSILLFIDCKTWVFAEPPHYGLKNMVLEDTINKFGNKVRKGLRLTGTSTCRLNVKGMEERGREVRVPLEVAGIRVGIIRLLRLASSESFDDYQVRLLSMISSPLALGLRNAEAHRQVQELALRDGLTNLLNRRSFMGALVKKFDYMQNSNTSLSLLMIDVDHFKKINDCYGHQVGDEVLKKVSQLLLEGVREIDIAARYGGEEFAVILPDVSKEIAQIVAERIRNRVCNYRFSSGDQVVRLTVSIGYALTPDPMILTPAELLEHADKALYRAKSNGRNRVEFGAPQLIPSTKTDN